jgi:hypothetical protein
VAPWSSVPLPGPVSGTDRRYRSVPAGGDTKTARSRRRLVLPQGCVDALRRRRDRLHAVLNEGTTAMDDIFPLNDAG